MQKLARNLPSAHHRTNLLGYIFSSKTWRVSTIRPMPPKLPHIALPLVGCRHKKSGNAPS